MCDLVLMMLSCRMDATCQDDELHSPVLCVAIVSGNQRDCCIACFYIACWLLLHSFLGRHVALDTHDRLNTRAQLLSMMLTQNARTICMCTCHLALTREQWMSSACRHTTQL